MFTIFENVKYFHMIFNIFIIYKVINILVIMWIMLYIYVCRLRSHTKRAIHITNKSATIFLQKNTFTNHTNILTLSNRNHWYYRAAAHSMFLKRFIGLYEIVFACNIFNMERNFCIVAEFVTVFQQHSIHIVMTEKIAYSWIPLHQLNAYPFCGIWKWIFCYGWRPLYLFWCGVSRIFRRSCMLVKLTFSQKFANINLIKFERA